MTTDIDTLSIMIKNMTIDDIKDRITVIMETAERYNSSKEKHVKMKGKADGLLEALMIFENPSCTCD